MKKLTKEVLKCIWKTSQVLTNRIALSALFTKLNT